MRVTLIACVLLAGLTVICSDIVLAGECTVGEETYLVALEAGPWSDPPLFLEAVYCLGSRHSVDGRLWAGPIAAQRFAALRDDPLRSQLATAVSKLLTTAWADSADHRHRLLQIAARWGIGRVDSTDVFGALFGEGAPAYYGAYQDMAILQDCRAVSMLSTRYPELRRHPERGYPDEVLDLLSCLYHIPCAQAVTLATELYSRETDDGLRARLRRVVERE